jgi:hypothetical protein
MIKTVVNLFIAAPILLSSASTDSDGCWVAFPPSTVISVSGSNGYSVDCALVVPATSMMVSKQFRSNAPMQAFLETDKRHRSLSSDLEICLQASNSTDVSVSPFAQFVLGGSYVVRGVAFSDSPVTGLATPVGYTVNIASTLGSADSVWYVNQTDSDSSKTWSRLPAGVPTMFDTDLVGSVLKVFPVVATASATQNGFGVTMYGCQVERTAIVSFKFQSSESAIKQRFNSISGFVSQLTSYVCVVTRLSSVPGPCSRILFADIVESSSSNPNVTAVTPFQPTTLPSLELFFRILPPNLKTCTDCRSAETVQSDLGAELSDLKSPGSRIMKAIDVWIQDSDPYTCYAKQCAAGTLCVNGVCVTPSDLAAQQATAVSLESDISFADTSFDSILNMSPLDVIDGVDQTQGLIRFAATAPPAGKVHVMNGAVLETTPAPSTTSEESPIQRFFIPICVLGGVILVVSILLGWRMYKRSQLSETQRLIAP